MKEEALKLADELDGLNSCEPVIIKACEDMIRRLVEELDKQWYMVNKDGYVKPLSDEEIKDEIGRVSSSYPTIECLIDFARVIEERHGIK